MYHHIRGTLIAKPLAEAIVEAGGIGYQLRIPYSTYDSLPAVGKPITLLTHLHVTDDAHTLYGFSTEEERRFFLQLVNSVKGVGPKMALTVLSGGPLEHIQQAIRLGDFKSLKAIKGLGEATAKRIVLELGKILIKEAQTAPAEGPAKGRKKSKQPTGAPAMSALSGLDEMTELAVRAVIQLNEVTRDVALKSVQRALDEFRAAGQDVSEVQDLIRKALVYAE